MFTFKRPFLITLFALAMQLSNSCAMNYQPDQIEIEEEEIDLEEQTKNQLLRIKKNLLEVLSNDFYLTQQVEFKLKDLENYCNKLGKKFDLNKNNKQILKDLALELNNIIKLAQEMIKKSTQEIDDINNSQIFCSDTTVCFLLLCMFLTEATGIVLAFFGKDIMSYLVSITGSELTGLVQGSYALIVLAFIGAPFICALIYMIQERFHQRVLEREQWKFDYKIVDRKKLIEAFEKLTDEQKEILNSIKNKLQELEQDKN